MQPGGPAAAFRSRAKISAMAASRWYRTREGYGVDVVIIAIGRGPPPRQFYAMARYSARWLLIHRRFAAWPTNSISNNTQAYCKGGNRP
ncbi:protein of unknown function [Methylocella tundrae]|uniref:Uncharacterized protein n=1 Tax=Methylocella tundrae TaxID=227605 RepID=A0A4U8Z400_METTU|nr:protein of unknown function [Methylocella tundrae]